MASRRGHSTVTTQAFTLTRRSKLRPSTEHDPLNVRGGKSRKKWGCGLCIKFPEAILAILMNAFAHYAGSLAYIILADPDSRIFARTVAKPGTRQFLSHINLWHRASRTVFCQNSPVIPIRSGGS